MSATDNLTGSTVDNAIRPLDTFATDDDVNVNGHVDPHKGTNGDAKVINPNGHVESLPVDNTSLLVKLSQTIARETEKVDAYFRENSIPAPTFEADGLSDYPALPDEVQKARLAVIKAAADLKDLMVGPKESLRWMAWDHNNSLSLKAVSQFKLANAFPVGSTATFAELSKVANIDEMNTRRLLRHAMTNRIFKEVSPGVVAHTAASKTLAHDDLLQDWVGYCVQDLWPSAVATLEALTRFPGSQEDTQTGFQVAFDLVDKESMFTALGKDPARGKQFHRAMGSLASGAGYEVEFFVDNYDWNSINEKAGTVVDVGGSHGFVSAAIAKKFDKIKFVVEDLPKALATAPKFEGDLAERITFKDYDYFTPQPVKGADVYFYRWIIHNTSDKYAIKILQSLVPGLKKGARIVINDHCLPEPNTESPWDEKIIRTMDLVMLSLINAQERSKEEFETIFHTANPNFRFLGVTRPAGCRMSIVEAVWEGEDYDGEVDAEAIVVEAESEAAHGGDKAGAEASRGNVEKTIEGVDAQVANNVEAVVAN
ncbi:hypothetical protein V502_02442 [Pseudogymnoascus sp. VKM F-4520 (FW-2644)]|nr:hypothetical protein V502_02442 [Pseudogymnoascus sp. VKM F-4520 (FW-2644)]